DALEHGPDQSLPVALHVVGVGHRGPAPAAPVAAVTDGAGLEKRFAGVEQHGARRPRGVGPGGFRIRDGGGRGGGEQGKGGVESVADGGKIANEGRTFRRLRPSNPVERALKGQGMTIYPETGYIHGRLLAEVSGQVLKKGRAPGGENASQDALAIS